jgi:hypothetical protein
VLQLREPGLGGKRARRYPVKRGVQRGPIGEARLGGDHFRRERQRHREHLGVLQIPEAFDLADLTADGLIPFAVPADDLPGAHTKRLDHGHGRAPAELISGPAMPFRPDSRCTP